MKEAMVQIDKTGYWVIIDRDTGTRIGRLYNDELEAYKVANAEGYIVR